MKQERYKEYVNYARYLCPFCDSMRTRRLCGHDKTSAKYICDVCDKKFYLINGKLKTKIESWEI